MSEIIKMKDIHKFYKNGKDSLEALKGVSFALKQGEILAIMGSSGSGKSMLLHIIGAMDMAELHVYSVETEENVQKLLIIFKGMLMVLFVIVVVISGMFILSIFHEYMRKYRKDMAVIRTVGGKRKQISLIFLSMSLTISFFGCTAGAVACVLFDDVLLNKINQKINLFSGSVIINWSVLIQMAATVFVLFNVFVMVFFLIGQNVLPIQVFQETSTGLRRNKKGNRFLGMRKLVGTEGYLGIKLLIPKFWQNAMIIFIIALITALSYTGQSSIKILNENNFSYYRDLMQGFDAYGEIQLKSGKTLEPDRIMEITEQIQEFSTQCYTLLGQFCEYGRTVNGKDLYGFYVTDLTGFMSQFRGTRMENWEVVPKEQRMIMTEKTAEYTGYQLGDTVTLDADWLGGKKKFTIQHPDHKITIDAVTMRKSLEKQNNTYEICYT